jgi:hypothetical protein|nr:MAG TPA: Protein of unknown function (DUF1043) [Caudoviricetes sp.]
MNTTVKVALAFAVGALVGALVARHFAEKEHEARLSEEVEAIRHFYQTKIKLETDKIKNGEEVKPVKSKHTDMLGRPIPGHEYEAMKDQQRGSLWTNPPDFDQVAPLEDDIDMEQGVAVDAYMFDDEAQAVMKLYMGYEQHELPLIRVTEESFWRGWADFPCFEMHYLAEDNLLFLADDESVVPDIRAKALIENAMDDMVDFDVDETRSVKYLRNFREETDIQLFFHNCGLEEFLEEQEIPMNRVKTLD